MDWEMRISEQMEQGAIDIFLFRRIAEGKIEYVSNLSGKGGMEVTVVEEGTRIEPSMRLGWNNQKILQTMADGLFKFGIKPTQQPVLQNELTATKYHLEDIREMISIVAGTKKGDDFGKHRSGAEACRPGG